MKVKGQVADSAIGPVTITGAKAGIYFDPSAVVRRVTMRGVTILATARDGVRIQGDVSLVDMAGFDISHAATPSQSPDLPSGIGIAQGSHIRIVDGKVRGFRMSRSGYPNGDGISSERAVDWLTIRSVLSTDNSDGGFDLKSTHTQLDDLDARRNYRNYRFWGQVSAGTLTSVDPADAHVWLGPGAEVVIERLVVRSFGTAPVFYLDGARRLVVKRCELDVPEGTVLMRDVAGGAAISLGEGCEIAGTGQKVAN